MIRAIRFCVLLLLLCSEAAWAQSAKTKLVSNGKTHALKFVSATRIVRQSGEAEMRILFASMDPAGLPLANEFATDEFAVPRWARSTGAAAVVITFAEKKTERSALTFYLPGGAMLSAEATRSGKAGRGAFKKLLIKGDLISGELSQKSPPGTLSGTFKITARTVREASERRGSEVSSTPQAVTLLAFAKAMRKVDVKNGQKYVAGDLSASVARLKKDFGDAAVKTLMRDRFGDLKQLERDLQGAQTTLLESTDRSELRLIRQRGSAPGTSELYPFVKVDGTWKLVADLWR
jgi:hypothetical protein